MDASYLHAAFYFLSEIRIRQTLNKSKEARKAGKNQLNMDLMWGAKDGNSFQPGIVSALEAEVDQWYENLPALIKFDPNFQIETFPQQGALAPPVTDIVAFLRTQYIATKIAFYWPASYDILTSSSSLESKPRYREAVIEHVTAVMRWIASVDQILNRRFSPQIWTLSQAYLYCFRELTKGYTGQLWAVWSC